MVSAWNGQRMNMLQAVPIYNRSRSTVIYFIKIIVWLRETRYTIVCVNTMPQFRVFLGAPSRRVSRIPIHSYQWHTIESKLRGIQPPPVIFPPATLEAASHRISLIHQDFIFKNQNDEELESSGDDDPRVRNLGSIRPTILHLTVLISNLLLDGTTVITWLLRQNAFSHLIPHLILTRQHKRQKRQFHITIQMRYPLVTFRPSHSTCTPSPRFLRSFLQVQKDNGKLLVAALEVEGPDTIMIKRGYDWRWF